MKYALGFGAFSAFSLRFASRGDINVHYALRFRVTSPALGQSHDPNMTQKQMVGGS